MDNSLDEFTNRIIYISHKRFKIHVAFIQIMGTSVVVALAYNSCTNFSMSKNIKLYGIYSL